MPSRVRLLSPRGIIRKRRVEAGHAGRRSSLAATCARAEPRVGVPNPERRDNGIRTFEERWICRAILRTTAWQLSGNSVAQRELDLAPGMDTSHTRSIRLLPEYLTLAVRQTVSRR